MIDLRALMASAKPEPPRAPASGAELTPLPVVRRLSVYPFGAPPEPEEPGAAAGTARTASKSSPRRLVLLLGLGAVIFAAGAVMLLLPRPQGSATETPPARPQAASPARLDSARLQATPEALPAPAIPTPAGALPAEDVLPAETADPTPPKAAPPPRATFKKPTPRASASPASGSVKSPPPADTCKGNLLCAMKRATAEH